MTTPSSLNKPVTLTKTRKTFLTGLGTVVGVALTVVLYNVLGSSSSSSAPSSSTRAPAAPGPTPSSTGPVGTVIQAPAGYSSVVRECVDGDGIYIPEGSSQPVTIVQGDLACPQLTQFPTSEPAPISTDHV